MDFENVVEVFENILEEITEEIRELVSQEVVSEESNDEFPPRIGGSSGYEEVIEYSADGSPVLIRLTPEQQAYFQEFSERLGRETEELNAFIQEQQEYRAIHSAPAYGGPISTDD